MNNFAGARNASVSKFPSSASADGGNATSAARSNGAGLKKAELRTPAHSSASTKRSDRTTAHEAHSTSSTCGGATAPSRQLKPNKAMNQQQPVSHFAGFDWARDHHDVVILDNGGRIVAEFRIEHTASGWKAWKEKIKAFPSMAVAIETSYGAAVEQLLDCDLQVYPVNPMNAKRYRERKCSSGNKTDRHDAWALADALRLDGHGWRRLSEQDPIVLELRILCRDEVALIEERTGLINQLQQALHEYFPSALEAFDDWCSPSSWAFVEAFPSADALQKAGRRKWEKFLHTHKLWRPQTCEKRITAFQNAGEWKIAAPTVAAKSVYSVAKARQLRVLHTQLEIYRERIEALFKSHPDSGLFGSLPGAGAKLAPRLLSEIGSDRALFSEAQSLQCLAGTAPISYQSGQVHKVYMRRHCNKNLRQAVQLFADKSRAQCAWAEIYYKALRERGKTHSQAVRSLGQRWLNIVWKMWQNRTSYDANLHMRNQIKHGSWVLNLGTQPA